MLIRICLAFLMAVTGLSHVTLSRAEDGTWEPLLQKGRSLVEQGRYREAQPVLAETLRQIDAEGVTGYTSVITASNLASCLQDLGNYLEAETLHRRAVREGEQLKGGRRLAMAVALNGYGMLLNRLGRTQQAIDLYERSLALRRELLGENHPAVARQIHNLAKVYATRDEPEKAIALLREAIAIWEKPGDDPGVTDKAITADLASSLSGLASVFAREGNLAEALPLGERSVSVWESRLDRGHPTFAMLLNNLAALYIEDDRVDRAGPLLQRALEVAKSTFGDDHPETATILANYAYVLKKSERGKEARVYQAKARDIWQRHEQRNYLGFTVDASQLVQKK